MKMKVDIGGLGNTRAVAKPPPGVHQQDSVLLRIARILFWIVIAKLVKNFAQNNFVRRWLKQLFPKFHSTIHQQFIDI